MVKPNTILVTDTLENVTKVEVLLDRLDADNSDILETLQFQFADAEQVRSALVELLGPSVNTNVRITTNGSSNILILNGDPNEILRIKKLATAMDVASRIDTLAEKRTKVFKLKFADAEIIAAILQNTIGGSVAVTNAVAIAAPYL